MTTSLPAGIESYLKEAGFSATEMLIIRKLVEEDCLTLRELAGKTGKSTGVLDLAMKKLLQKKDYP
jgi:DNA-binding MarR family transcriptional regulator